MKVSVFCFTNLFISKAASSEKNNDLRVGGHVILFLIGLYFSRTNSKGRVMGLNAEKVIIHSETSRLAFIGKVYREKTHTETFINERSAYTER